MLFERFINALESIAKSLAEGKTIPGVVQTTPTNTTALAPTTEAPKPPRASRTTKPEPEATKPEATKPEAPKAEAFPYERLKKAIIDLAQVGANGRTAAVDLLGSYGVKKADQAPPEKWQEMFEKAVAKLAELTSNDDNFA